MSDVSKADAVIGLINNVDSDLRSYFTPHLLYHLTFQYYERVHACVYVNAHSRTYIYACIYNYESYIIRKRLLHHHLNVLS